jgi:hypothetical protein
MKCWHKWIIKKHARRVFFEWWYDSPGTWCIADTIASAATLYFLIPKLEHIDSAERIVILLSGFLMLWLAYFMGGAIFIEMCDDLLRKKDKICVKCHRSSLAATQYEKNYLLAFQAKIAARKAAIKANEEQLEAVADEVFQKRKADLEANS